VLVQQARFQAMSDAIIGRIDEMGGRIDELERSISDLMTQAGVEQQPGAQGQGGAQPGNK
jgi:heat shock factor-binding protein 1